MIGGPIRERRAETVNGDRTALAVSQPKVAQHSDQLARSQRPRAATTAAEAENEDARRIQRASFLQNFHGLR